VGVTSITSASATPSLRAKASIDLTISPTSPCRSLGHNLVPLVWRSCDMLRRNQPNSSPWS
jgi:hypothetical protein